MWGSVLGSIGGSIASGLLGQSGARAQMRFNRQEAEKNRQFQERMSSTAHQRQVADMRAAGLNPILSATGGKGASTPSGAQASTSLNPKAEMAHSARQLALMTSQIKNVEADTDLKHKQAKSQSASAEVSDMLADAIKAVRAELGLGGTPDNSAKTVKDAAQRVLSTVTDSVVNPSNKRTARQKQKGESWRDYINRRYIKNKG